MGAKSCPCTVGFQLKRFLLVFSLCGESGDKDCPRVLNYLQPMGMAPSSPSFSPSFATEAALAFFPSPTTLISTWGTRMYPQCLQKPPGGRGRCRKKDWIWLAEDWGLWSPSAKVADLSWIQVGRLKEASEVIPCRCSMACHSLPSNFPPGLPALNPPHPLTHTTCLRSPNHLSPMICLSPLSTDLFKSL